ncbi:MAG: imidazole glycerol phosphate synthase subunit HisH [Candidatus Omnitrophica bacterium]|nr:imidazole glycerol phosphate synthase subunit HisH [Candidatus Omnitrophota bacterium]
MSQVIGVIDYGQAGNIFNIRKVFELAKKEVKIVVVKSGQDLKSVDKIVIPGVGTYKGAMESIAPFYQELRDKILKVPTLGICLGMQILSEIGYEFGETPGLKYFEGAVRLMPVKHPVPHIGWANVEVIRPSKILKGVTAEDVFYFMHSYEFINYKDVAGLSNYIDHSFVSVVERDQVFGVQFHPEKSRTHGLKIIDNFLSI